MRIYLVTSPKGPRLVEATNKATAVGHCARTDYRCELASQQDLVDLTKQNVSVERAGEVAPAAEANRDVAR